MERGRSRSKSFYEDEEEDDDVGMGGCTPMPDFSAMDFDKEDSGGGSSAGRTPMPDGSYLGGVDGSSNGEIDDDVDPELDKKLEELAGKNEEDYEDARRRSRSFFDQTDVSSGLASALPPQVTADRKDSIGDPVKIPERTGKLKSNELLALSQGLSEAHGQLGMGSRATDRRDSDLDVDEDEERRRQIEDLVFEKLREEEALRSPPKTGGAGGDRRSQAESKDKLSDLEIKIKRKKKARKIKLLMLGDSGVGKTSLMSRFTEDKFNPNMVGTLGVDFKVRELEISGERVNVQVWDTAGQERFRKITKTYYKNADGIVLVYDVCSLETFRNVGYWLQNIKESAVPDVEVNIVGNKIDLRKPTTTTTTTTTAATTATTATTTNSEGSNNNGIDAPATETIKKTTTATTTSEGQKIASDNNIEFYETSAKDTTNVDKSFVDLITAIVTKQIKREEEERADNGDSEDDRSVSSRESETNGAKKKKTKIFKKGVGHAVKKKMGHAKDDCVIS